MSRLKQLIQEIHRRSLWQVLLIYIAASWVVFQVVQTVTEGLGLPTWFPAFAALLLLKCHLGESGRPGSSGEVGRVPCPVRAR